MKILITGGSGSLGSCFIETYNYTFSIVSRNEELQRLITNRFSVKPFLCSIENKEMLYTIYNEVQPDVVIHAAALKHVDFAEKNPIQAATVNVEGSLNVIQASIKFGVPITIAISSDKALDKSIYGQTKSIMEKCFISANQKNIKFAVCRLGNIAGSAGSVIPFWKNQAKQGNCLAVTDERMTRFFFSKQEAAEAVKYSIDLCLGSDPGGFIITKKMKSVKIMELARAISPNLEIVGSRPGEELSEKLISFEESKRAIDLGDYIYIGEKVVNSHPYHYSSETTEFMSANDINNLLQTC